MSTLTKVIEYRWIKLNNKRLRAAHCSNCHPTLIGRTSSQHGIRDIADANFEFVGAQLRCSVEQTARKSDENIRTTWRERMFDEEVLRITFDMLRPACDSVCLENADVLGDVPKSAFRWNFVSHLRPRHVLSFLKPTKGAPAVTNRPSAAFNSETNSKSRSVFVTSPEISKRISASC
ncbi:hypothetical protein [Paraburkholderia sp.]|uniref:hypothetical protein n=1 Tax=Paraburkholderia sp. TaxID=1926495 RepID=UPI0023A373EA|nr:hypothetical protein [Paraburkholderia sp.]MDE1182554.1 hypothetical protein [Paraburkholderia sp.]